MSTNSTTTGDTFELYNYTPNKGAAILFTILFILITCGLTFLVAQHASRSKQKVSTWSQLQGIRYYMVKKLTGGYIPLLVGCVVEAVGYIFRCISSKNKESVAAYSIQSILLLIAPTLYAASIYMLFGRMAHLLFAEKIMIMPARWNTTIFVLGDIGSLFLQAAGGGLMATDGNRKSGSNLVTAGLFIQIAFFGLFIINEFFFLFKVYKVPSDVPRKSKTWKLLNINLLVNSFLILVRSVVRAIEFIQGFNGFIISHEWFLYVFDALPMFVLPVFFAATFHITNIYMIQEDSVNIQMHNAFQKEETGDETESSIIQQLYPNSTKYSQETS